MYEIITNIISALTGIVGGIVGAWAMRYFSRKDRFLDEAYQRRLAVYEDVIKELPVISETDGSFLNLKLSEETVSQKIEEVAHTLEALRARLDLYGSPAARTVISILWIDLYNFRETFARAGCGEKGGKLIALLTEARSQFIGFVRKETGADLLDKETKTVFKAVQRK